MMHQALDDSDQTRKYGISESIIQALIMTLLHRNIGLVSWIRDAILSRLVTIIKRLVHHAVYCISLSCFLSFLCNPYIPFLISEIFHLLVLHICTQTDWQAGRHAGRQAGRHAGRQAGRQAGMHAGRQACRQAGRHAGR